VRRNLPLADELQWFPIWEATRMHDLRQLEASTDPSHGILQWVLFLRPLVRCEPSLHNLVSTTSLQRCSPASSTLRAKAALQSDVGYLSSWNDKKWTCMDIDERFAALGSD